MNTDKQEQLKEQTMSSKIQEEVIMDNKIQEEVIMSSKIQEEVIMDNKTREEYLVIIHDLLKSGAEKSRENNTEIKELQDKCFQLMEEKSAIQNRMIVTQEKTIVMQEKMNNLLMEREREREISGKGSCTNRGWVSRD